MKHFKNISLSRNQIFKFDLHGFLIINHFISPEVIIKMNQLIDDRQGGASFLKFDFLGIDPIFMDLLSDESVMNIAGYILGDWFRLDNVFGFQDDPAQQHTKNCENLHAGPFANQNMFQYHWFQNRPFTNALHFAYCLKDVEEGDGGLVMIPGSHKNNLGLTGDDVYHEVLNGNLDQWWVHNPSMKAGDLLIFTEALIHGTKKWQPKDRGRRMLYYKYCPGYANWLPQANIQQYANLARNEIEKKLFLPAFVADHDKSEAPLWTNHWREPVMRKRFKQPLITEVKRRIKNLFKRK